MTQSLTNPAERLAAPGPFKVLVLDRVDPAGIAILGEVAQVDARDAIDPAELLRIIGEYDALMVRSATKVTAEVLEAGTRLKIVGRAGVGVDNIDVPAATKRGVIVVNSPDGNTIAAAEHALSLMFALTRHVPGADTAMKRSEWKRERFMGTELYHKTLGVLGLGKIGAKVAKVARALDMRVLGCDPFLTPERAQELGVEPVSFDELVAASDFISIHVPKTPETTKLFNAESLARCKAGVRIVNCARGGIIDEGALVDAIRSGHVAGAALDVFEKEPLGESALRELGEAIVLTPHLGASTEEAQIKVAVDVAEQISEVLKGGSARAAVNIPTMRPEVVEPVRPFMGLAEKLGSFAAQLLDGAIERIEILYHGGLAGKNVEPLTVAALKGALSHAVPEGVNYVNAPLVAKERGIEVRESRSNESRDYADLMSVTVIGGGQWHTVAGTVFGEGDARLVRIDEHAFNMAPVGDILIVPHQDRPGSIGVIGTLLGEEGVNIFGFQLGRKYKKGPAVMALNVDDAINVDLLARIGNIDGFHDVRFVRL
jgi:D-3-phosphoglycerate dehydrogenase